MKRLENVEWHYWHNRQRTPLLLYFFYYAPAVSTLAEFPNAIKTNGSSVNKIITSKEELEHYGQMLWQKFLNEPLFILSVMKDAYRKNKEDIAGWQEFLKKDYSWVSDEVILEDYTRYVQSMVEYGPYVYFPLAVEPLLAEEVRKVVGSDEGYDIVMTPVNESSQIELRLSLLKVALGKENLKVHCEQFSFLKRKGMFMDFFDEKYYREEIASCPEPSLELHQLEEETKRKTVSFSFLLEKYKDDVFISSLLKTTNEAISFRSWRTDAMEQSSYYLVPLFKEIARRTGLREYIDLLYLLPDELTEMFKRKKIDTTLIRQRKEAFVFLTTPEGLITVQGEEAKIFDASLNIVPASLDNKEVRGNPAFRGVVRGKATLVQDHHDYEKIKDAEVLITHTTAPDMVPYLSGIRAIVTEEGGILSHAAVISREFKIPCVVGTKTATSVFRDGDDVEVDAEQGIVRKIG